MIYLKYLKMLITIDDRNSYFEEENKNNSNSEGIIKKGYFTTKYKKPNKKEILKNKTEIKLNLNMIKINIIILLDLLKILSTGNFKLFKLNLSSITLKIKVIGYSYVLGHESDFQFKTMFYPNETYINGIKQEIVTYGYNFNETDNDIKLIWYDNINNLANIFRSCCNITAVNFSNFTTSQVTDMGVMFWECSSLTSLDLSNFVTSNVKWMNHMFYKCTSLSSLNLSNFETSAVTTMKNMFYGCSNLEYINLQNFNEIKLSTLNEMFANVPNNVVICINESVNSKIMVELSSKICKINYCFDDWKSKQKKLNIAGDQCFDKCDNGNFIYEYNGKCYENCTGGILYNSTNECKCELKQCLLCPQVPLNKNLCTQCNFNYYSIQNDPLNIGKYINCYSHPKGYYLDKSDLLF